MSRKDSDVMGAIEALLFVSDEPVATSRLAKIVEAPVAEVESVLRELASEYAEEERGFQLREVAGGWRLYTHPAYHSQVEEYVLSWDTRRLSQAALEALAVIAYHQPVTRQGVNAIRGVNSEAVISSLIEKGFVREAGRDRNPGSAILYGTTRTFLERFGLKDLSELPPIEEFAPDPDTELAIRERLNALEGSVLDIDEGLDAEEDVDPEDDDGAEEE
ncbi:MAG: SMC-Scp complex subunit ScpB [Coriobacteriia bacterium]|nr:SMC-Scp complex subunit ScpB [Coriobacteriia bacterium]